MIAHVAGVPVEELLPVLSSTGGILVARVWIAVRVRLRRRR